MYISDFMSKNVFKATLKTTVKEAVLEMERLNIGSILIESRNKLKGIFSERDLLKKVVSEKKDVNKTLLKDVMTIDIFTVLEDEPIEKAINIMNEKKIRHLPVVNSNNSCIGMIGIKNIMEYLLDNLEKENKLIVNAILSEVRIKDKIKSFSEKQVNLLLEDKPSGEFSDLAKISLDTLNRLSASFDREQKIIKKKK